MKQHIPCQSLDENKETRKTVSFDVLPSGDIYRDFSDPPARRRHRVRSPIAEEDDNETVLFDAAPSHIVEFDNSDDTDPLFLPSFSRIVLVVFFFLAACGAIIVVEWRNGNDETLLPALDVIENPDDVHWLEGKFFEYRSFLAALTPCNHLVSTPTKLITLLRARRDATRATVCSSMIVSNVTSQRFRDMPCSCILYNGIELIDPKYMIAPPSGSIEVIEMIEYLMDPVRTLTYPAWVNVSGVMYYEEEAALVAQAVEMLDPLLLIKTRDNS